MRHSLREETQTSVHFWAGLLFATSYDATDQQKNKQNETKANKSNKEHFKIDVTRFTTVPLEAFTYNLIFTTRITGTVVVAPLTSYQFCRTYSTGVDDILRKVGVAFFTTAGVGSLEVEALRVFGTIVELGALTLIEVRGLEALLTCL